MSDDPNPHVTVAKDTYELHTRAANLLDTMLRNPKTSREAEKLIKEINPEAKFPASDLAESYISPIKAELEAARKEIADTRTAWEKDRADRQERETVAQLTERLAKVEKKYGFDEAMRESVLKRMQEQNSPDVEAAAAFVYEGLPKPPPANARTSDNFLPQKVDLYGSVSRDEQWKNLHENPTKYFDDTVREVMRDPSLAQ